METYTDGGRERVVVVGWLVSFGTVSVYHVSDTAVHSSGSNILFLLSSLSWLHSATRADGYHVERTSNGVVRGCLTLHMKWSILGVCERDAATQAALYAIRVHYWIHY